MSFIRVLILFLFLFSIYSCENFSDGNDSLPHTQHSPVDTININYRYKAGELINNVSCLKNASINYALYLPSNYNSHKKYAVIFFFDAHARGSKPLKLYQSLADKYEIIFVGSNNSKNGLPQQALAEIVNTTMNDALQKLSIDNKQIYTCGFSGGAKVASMAALGSKEIKDVIACAAPMPAEMTIMSLTFNYTAIAGVEDFNLKDMAKQELELKNPNHSLLVFSGKHEWPPVIIMEKAIRNVWCNAMNENRIKKDENFIADTKKTLKDSLFNFIPDKNKIEQEEQMQDKYIRALQEKDFNWWKNEVLSLNKKIIKEKPETYINKRTLNYLSMVCYMLVNNHLSQKQLKQAGYYVDIYELVDPENPDVYFYKSIVYAGIGNRGEALKLLEKSAQLGFEDIEKLQQEPSFKKLNGDPKYEEIVSAVANNISK